MLKMSLQSASPEMLELLKELRKKLAIGFVGGSDLAKITEQLTVNGNNRKCGLAAYPTFDVSETISIAQLVSQPSTISTLHLQRMV
jgi:Eukaryotic phosphomannomutase